MEDWITGTLVVLGTLMLLSGGAIIVLRTLGLLSPPTGQPEPAPVEPAGRRLSWRKLSPATQLIGWGVALLVVAAFTVGLISFGITLEAGTPS